MVFFLISARQWRQLQKEYFNMASAEIFTKKATSFFFLLFVCVEVLRPSQPNGVMSSSVSLPNHTFTGQA